LSSFASRSLVLAFARLMNQAMLMLSPIMLVRLLDVTEYGRYRQFTVTAVVVAQLASFAIPSGINYFVARSPQQSATFITNSALLLAVTTLIAAIAVILGRHFIVPDEIFQYWPLFIIYVVLFVNLDLLSSYWLANRRSDRVLLYTLAVTIWRLSAVIGSAYVFGEVRMIFVSLVIAEATKVLLVYIGLRRSGLLVFRWDGNTLREQLRYVVPLGWGSFMYHLNEHAGKILVSSRMGAQPLAIFVTAAYQVPLITIIKTALADVVFPDMVARSARDPLQGLRLWKRMNVLFFAMVCPVWLLLTYFAEPIIRLLFTPAYVSATPYFQVLLLMMIRQCFSFSEPLRSVADNNSFALANAIGLAMNLAIILPFMPVWGLWAPTLGLVLSQAWVAVFLGRRVKVRFNIPVSQLCEWNKLGLALTATLIAFVVLHASQLLLPDSLASGLLGACLYGLVYFLATRHFLRSEYEYIRDGLREKLLRRARAAPG
jgi:O-antigen/teichoic acid export membrane protein